MYLRPALAPFPDERECLVSNLVVEALGLLFLHFSKVQLDLWLRRLVRLQLGHDLVEL